MSVGRIRHLRTKWQADIALQGALECAFDSIGFDQSYVDSCVARASAGLAPRKTKHIKDNVWGMIEVQWRTGRLLDCPVIQRLRGIKQLGLSFLTYPSAEHSRFTHSLGMACVVSRLLESIDKRAQESEPNGAQEDLSYVTSARLGPTIPEDLVHAAILHDVGHMPFSHATEKSLKYRDELFTCGSMSVAELLYRTQRQLKKEISLSETLSLLVILSTRFSQFFDGFVRHGSEDPDALLRIGSLIAGLPPTPRLTGAADIISAAALDADKIDYLNRDAAACGIPVGIDVARIFLRSGFVQATRAKLIQAGLKEDPAEEEILFFVNASGMDTVDEVTQARTALYQRVYLHAVTRAAEALLARALRSTLHPTRNTLF